MPRQRIEKILDNNSDSRIVPNPPSGETVLLSVEDVANLYGVHTQTVYKAIREGRIPAHRVQRSYICVAHELPSVWPGDAGT